MKQQLRKSRKDRDVVKSLCIEDKIKRLDVTLRSFNKRRAALEAAEKEDDEDLANHEFTLLTALFPRAEQLEAEARRCIGEAWYVGGVHVTADVPDFGPDDPSAPPDLIPVAMPPRYASPTR